MSNFFHYPYSVNQFKGLEDEDEVEELKAGTTYRVDTTPQMKTGTHMMKKGDLVTLIRKGSSLYLVQSKADTATRTWIPGSCLAPLIVKGAFILNSTWNFTSYLRRSQIYKSFNGTDRP